MPHQKVFPFIENRFCGLTVEDLSKTEADTIIHFAIAVLEMRPIFPSARCCRRDPMVQRRLYGCGEDDAPADQHRRDSSASPRSDR